MKVDNPFLEQKRDLILLLDQERDPKIIKELQKKYAEAETNALAYNQKIIENLRATIKTKLERKKYVSKEFIINPKKQYKEAKQLYRDALTVVDDIKQLKKECLEGLNLTKKKNVIQKTKIDRWIK